MKKRLTRNNGSFEVGDTVYCSAHDKRGKVAAYIGSGDKVLWVRFKEGAPYQACSVDNLKIVALSEYVYVKPLTFTKE